MYKSLLLIFIIVLLNKISFAQDTLPKISVTQLNDKVLVSWINDFSTVTTINIQRSSDSLKNFTTIGSVLNVKARNNGFVDSKLFIPTQYYRVFISFEGGSYTFSQSHRPGVDTAKEVDEVADEVNEIMPPPKPLLSTPPPAIERLFVPSKFVYTGKENNIIISLPDAEKKRYSIKFFEDNGTPIFELKKITQTYLTLDKVNFIHAGLFDFEIYSDGILIEKHKVFIPKDGKPMPSLDVNGHEVK